LFRRLALGAAASLVSAAVVAVPVLTPSSASAAAPGGSLVFIKGGNVWLSAPDGSGQQQVSRGGGFSSPSMSDDGTIAALKGDDLVVMKANGTAIAQRELPDLFFEGSCSTVHVTPPLEAVISPDGDHLAWSQLRTSNCGGRLVVDDLTAITATGRATLDGPYLGYDPAWVGNDKIAVDDEAVVHLVPVGHGQPKGISWFDAYDLWDTYAADLNTPAISRDGSRVAYLADDYQLEKVLDHATTGNPVTGNNPGVPSRDDVCAAQAGVERPDDGPILDDLMFSPDGTALVHVEAGDVWTINGVGSGDCESRTFTKVLDGVDDVFWSAATPSTAPEPDRTAPTVTLDGVKVLGRKAVVTFSGSDDTTAAARLRFECQVDAGTRRACTSPTTVKNLGPGKHTVKVWAVDQAGNASAPATERFKVRRR
jgi:hypothetical protein